MNTPPVIYLIILFILFLPFIYHYETFNVVSYNNETAPDNSSQSFFETNSIQLQKLFKTIKSNQNIIQDDTFTLLNNNISFQFEDNFKNYLLQFLKSLLDNQDLYIHGQLFDIYTKSSPGITYYIFKSKLINQLNFSSDLLETTLSLDNNKIQIHDIKLILNSQKDTILPGLFKTRYIIKNKYHLMDPFLTSSNENIIDDPMKEKFKTRLDQKATKLLTFIN